MKTNSLTFYPVETDDSLLDEYGYPIEMNPSEKKTLEEAEYAERLQFAVAENHGYQACKSFIGR